MKHWLLNILLTLLVSLNGLAQDSVSLRKQKKAIYYVEANSGMANEDFVIGFGTGIFIKKGWGISFNAKEVHFKAKFLPDDYSPGWSLLGDDPIPMDQFYFYTVSASKEIDSKWKKLKLGVESGVTYLRHRFYSDFQPIDDDYGLFGGPSNYKATFKKEKAYGLYINSRLKFLPDKNAGFGISAWAILNKIENYYGVEINLLLGRLK
ncbi:MAG: hypothetical protein K2Q24_02430 [Chitinophagaceae bacterium]|nr:hypothetical protein [Chitinophagaceae bacterium]